MANGNGATQFSSKWMNFIGGFLAVAVTIIVSAQTIIPYFFSIAEANASLIGQQQTLFQNVFIMVISFFFGASVGTRLKDSTIDTLTNTNAAAQATVLPTKITTIEPGQTATVVNDANPSTLK